MQRLQRYLILVRGAGDLASGVIARLHRAGFRVVAAETARPTAIRRTVAFAQAVFDGETRVEDLTARRSTMEEVPGLLAAGVIPVIVDPDGSAVATLRPDVLVDAIVAKRNLGTRISDAPLVIALGPGFTAGVDAHVVVETHRGHFLGRVIRQGSAEADTGMPGAIAGHAADRVLRAPCDGEFMAVRAIGDAVAAGDVVATAGGRPVITPIGGILRGLLHDGLAVTAGMKVGDVDPRARREHCYTFSDKALAVAGGVLEAVLAGL